MRIYFLLFQKQNISENIFFNSWVENTANFLLGLSGRHIHGMDRSFHVYFEAGFGPDNLLEIVVAFGTLYFNTVELSIPLYVNILDNSNVNA